eukprot:scaffold194530_cov17-Tisochrysis_lutea.AAC.2
MEIVSDLVETWQSFSEKRRQELYWGQGSSMKQAGSNWLRTTMMSLSASFNDEHTDEPSGNQRFVYE